jgi:hypothetical protein
VPNIKEFNDKILQEAHESDYFIHPGRNKMYHNLKATYWWYGMKRNVAEYVALRNTYQRVRPSIMGLPRTRSGYDSIWVIMDRLTKVTHFIPVKMTYSELQLAGLYMSRIVCLHGVPKKIMSDRGTQFNPKL